VQDIASSKVPPVVPFRSESGEVAMQIYLRSAEPSPVPYTYQPDAGKFPSGRLTSSAMEAQNPLGHFLI
jgi:hypothetical protein